MGKENKNKIFFGTLIFISLPLLLLLGSSTAYAAELTSPPPGAPTYIDISVKKAHEMLESNPEEIILLDVRTEGEYNAEYIPGAINIPLPDLEKRIAELDSSKAIIVYCQSGGRSRTAGETLAQRGFIVYNMEGGINGFVENIKPYDLMI
ncbi:rhodanese-like domain-containing protein [Methanophagales archaeon]|nr:MAG: rhodanese-like domain-containing protein [Methanophagales archaeon]